ncbi:hypothetical protein D187_008062 [Cystobacter fuscus DSM 2262]|uniref:DUF2855 family protein n=1 Tax=Cystobacter fuscus (strain ATCC 25194 / DSM 2262 / NBRC 100088 / M29) TaxID=1242864 RepID=S9NWY7_CYSF2|nr:DUF2855 family protein [Cystobacter fuscus]EPX56720.1 hypothetical protein D187_008062 [Cystobacter fuscus DSM 2262]
MSMGWDFLVARDNLERVFVEPSTDPTEQPLAPGEAVLTVERFALTANNITYGVMGEALGYWRCFPTAPDWRGRIPAWGYARVSRSASPEAPVGLRFFGLVPMSTHFVARLQRTGSGYMDAATHRAGLSPFYNRYTRVEVDESFDNHRALLRPLFATSFLLDDMLYEAEHAGTKTVILSSASSKTAMGLAWLLSRHGMKVVGLTSRKNLALLGGLGLYQQLVPYDAMAGLWVETPAVFVDFAGEPAVVRGIHRQLKDGLRQSTLVGGTHQRTPPASKSEPLPGPTPTFFFAPDRLRKRVTDWGLETFEARLGEAMKAFVAASSWLRLEHHRGPEALKAVYRDVVTGQARPEAGHIVWPDPASR